MNKEAIPKNGNKMKYITLLILAILFIGCQGEQANTHAKERVNIFLSMGQSNAVGMQINESITADNVFIPIELIAEYPQYINFSPMSNYGINRVGPSRLSLNAAVEVSKQYHGVHPLYVINIAQGGTSVDDDRLKNYWSPYREDYDGNSFYPQTLNFLNVLFKQLQDEGKDPHVIGFDWNQWESEAEQSADFLFGLYTVVFDGITATFPNDDYKLFICNPTAQIGNAALLREVFAKVQQNRGNVVIYKPDELSSNVFREDGIHYTAETYAGFAELMLSEMEY